MGEKEEGSGQEGRKTWAVGFERLARLEQLDSPTSVDDPDVCEPAMQSHKLKTNQPRAGNCTCAGVLEQYNTGDLQGQSRGVHNLSTVPLISYGQLTSSSQQTFSPGKGEIKSSPVGLGP